MHILFLAPETQVYYREFVRGLKDAGARVTGLGHAPRERLGPALRPLLDDYVQVRNLFDGAETLAAAREIARRRPIDRVEMTDEPLVVPTAVLREALGLPGPSVKTATLCRDKSAMKDFLREHGIPCASSRAASSDAELREFAERVGYPVVVKPRAGFGSLNTHRADSAAELDRLLPGLGLGSGRSVAVEEFVDGHEGFYDTIMLDEGVGHEFISHYYPGCLEATLDRSVSPQIAVTNRVDAPGYAELKEVGRKVNRLLGLGRTATHMEWFFGSKGLKFSEIGARPAGERIWDMYRVANDFDVYREWAEAVVHGRTTRAPSRRWAVGSIQIRPDRDGRYAGHEGLDAARREVGAWIYESEVPRAGTPTQPLERGWLVNTWFRLRHPDYDRLLAMMTFLGRTVKALAQP
jgi:biotin carboxylase